MIQGACLCGGVRFEIDAVAGPFELCHCSRCRKLSGSAFFGGVGVRAADFQFLQGRELIRYYDAPILRKPPAYRSSFCGHCGSPVPNPSPEAEWLEVPAGLLEGDPGLRPERHIMVDCRAPWFEISDGLPQLDRHALRRLRASQS